MEKKSLYIIGVLILLFVIGCGTVGENFNSSFVKGIQNSITNQEDILDRFGLPFKEGIENGKVVWTYQFDKWSILKPTESKDLVILFDEKNIVKAYRYTTSQSE